MPNSDLAYRVAELERRMNNLLRKGTVCEADYAVARVRVRSGDLITAWLPWFTRRASHDRDWWAPEVGEQVMLLSPCGDPAQGVVLPAIYQDAHSAPSADPDVHRVEFSDGAVIEYDRKVHVLSAIIPGDVVIEAEGDLEAVLGGMAKVEATKEILLKAPQVVVLGTITMAGGVSEEGHAIADEFKHANTRQTGAYTLEGPCLIKGSARVEGDLNVSGTVSCGALVQG